MLKMKSVSLSEYYDSCDDFKSATLYIQGVFKMRVLILTPSRDCEMKRFFLFEFFTKKRYKLLI
jgi:hypothetical protein